MRRKLIALTILILAVLSIHSFAQEEEMVDTKSKEEPKIGWLKKMVGSLNLTQNRLSNWTQGGEDSFAWQLNLNFLFVNNREKTNWANSGKFIYGTAKLGEKGFRKSIDEIKMESVLTYKIGSKFNPFLAATWETQFAPAYDYEAEPATQISSFMDPGYFRESIGVNYMPNGLVRTRFGLALKQTIAHDFRSSFTDDPDTEDKIEWFKQEAGFESVTDVSWKISENSLYMCKLELFYAAGSSLDETDVNWDNVLSVKIAKYIGITFNFNLLYDKDISSRRQIQQSIALSLTYDFL
jgi:hypothetical protein